MSFFKAETVAQIPYEYKGIADFIFEQQEVKYGNYPTTRFKCIKQPAMDTPDRVLGEEGSTEYEKSLKPRVVPGTVVVTGPTVDAGDPVDEVLTDDGKDFIIIGEGDNYFEVKSAAEGVLGYKLTLMAQPLVYEDEDTAEIKDIDLDASFSNNHLVVKLGREDSAQSVADVGDSNAIIVSFIKHGAFGNDWEVIIDIDNEVIRPLNVEVDESNEILSVELATGEVADDPATVTIETKEGGDPAPAFSVTATAGQVFDGIEGNGILVRFVEDSGEGGLTTVWNSENMSIDIDFGGLATVSALDIASAISAIEVESETVFVGAQVEAGDFVAATDLVPDEYGMFTYGNLAGGTNELDAAENTRTAVKALIEAYEVDDVQIWEVDLDGNEGAFTVADEGTYDFEDGDDGGELDDTKNTLFTVHAAIHALDEFACEDIEGNNATVVDEDDFVEEELFNTYLIDSDDVERGTVNRTTGKLEVTFSAVTVLPPTVTSKYYKFHRVSSNNITNVALAHPQYTTVYVDLRGEGRIYHSAHPFST